MTKRSCANFWLRLSLRSPMRRLFIRAGACIATRTTDIFGSPAIRSAKDWSLPRVTAGTDSNLPRCSAESLPTPWKEKITHYRTNSAGDQKPALEAEQTPRGSNRGSVGRQTAEAIRKLPFLEK